MFSTGTLCRSSTSVTTRVKEMHTFVENAMIAQLCKENVKEFIIPADKYQGERG